MHQWTCPNSVIEDSTLENRDDGVNSLPYLSWNLNKSTYYLLKRNVGKKLLCFMQTAKIQISVRIRAVWSGHSLFVDIYYSSHWFCKRTTKAQISVRMRACWFWPALSADCNRAIFVHCTPILIFIHNSYCFLLNILYIHGLYIFWSLRCQFLHAAVFELNVSPERERERDRQTDRQTERERAESREVRRPHQTAWMLTRQLFGF